MYFRSFVFYDSLDLRTLRPRFAGLGPGWLRVKAAVFTVQGTVLALATEMGSAAPEPTWFTRLAFFLFHVVTKFVERIMGGCESISTRRVLSLWKRQKRRVVATQLGDSFTSRSCAQRVLIKETPAGSATSHVHAQ